MSPVIKFLKYTHELIVRRKIIYFFKAGLKFETFSVEPCLKSSVLIQPTFRSKAQHLSYFVFFSRQYKKIAKNWIPFLADLYALLIWGTLDGDGWKQS